MKYAISNIAWPIGMTEEVLAVLCGFGISGIEVAPSKVWGKTDEISFHQVEGYRKLIERFGLKIVGLHSLLYGHPNLGLFKSKDIEVSTGKFFEKLIGVCTDLGGKTLIFGSPNFRRRGKIPLPQAMVHAADFFRDVAEKARKKQVFFCIEPLGPDETDFIDSAYSALEIIKMVDNPGFQGHLDAKAIYSSNEVSLKIFEDFSPVLKHFHANEPGLKPMGSTSLIDHKLFGRYLRQINYGGYVSIEQKMPDDEILKTIKKSISILKSCYKN